MKRENLLIGLVLFLVILNASVLYLFSNRGGGPPPHDRIIVQTLGFDEQQQRRFEDLKRDHRMQIVEIEKKYERTLESYFQMLTADDQVRKDSLESVIADLEARKARVTFRHFQDLRNLCRPDQQKAFDDFVPELSRFIIPQGPKNRPPHRRNP